MAAEFTILDRMREMGHKYIDNPRGHVWQSDKDGDLDIFAYAYANHNGPKCVNCGYGFCHHCTDGPQEDCSVQGKSNALPK